MTTPQAADRGAFALCPPGYFVPLILAAVTKQILSEQKLTTAQRMDALENLNGLPVGADILASIEPASKTEMALFWEASSLDRDREGRCDASYSLLQKSFEMFAAANPSLKNAAVAIANGGA